MSFRVIYDANALFGALQRSILVRVGVHQTKFNLRIMITHEILDEMTAAVRNKYPDFSTEQGDSLKAAIIASVSDCLVTDYDQLVPTLEISDPDDRHVLAAAIHARAQAIITDDRDFDQVSLEPYDLVAQSPDDFLTDLFDLNPTAMRQLVAEEAFTRDDTIDDLIDLLEERGLIRFAQHLKR